jgi:uncharacterized protein (DUF1499 family)
MLRRLMMEEPPSRLAIWSRRLVLFALAVALLAIVLGRGGIVETVPGLVIMGGAVVTAGLGILLALAAFVVIWLNGNPGFGKALAACVLGGALIAYPVLVAVQGYRLPTLADISTDPQDPPRFEVVARLRGRGANPVQYEGAAAAEKQRAAYPDIEPLRFSSTPQEVYTAVLEVVTRRKWPVVEARAPQTGRRDGHIEAVARSLIMGFREDVAIRVRAVANGSVLDIRSASRYGRHDLGGNAQRIRGLVEAIEEELGSAQPTRR